jgi:peptidoglycan/xylan/chitin deacetylase (PgdA/CDA1 family)
MSREVHVRICGGRRVRFPPSTRQYAGMERQPDRAFSPRTHRSADALATCVVFHDRLSGCSPAGVPPGRCLGGYVALKFDDGPNESTTLRIVSELRGGEREEYSS